MLDKAKLSYIAFLSVTRCADCDHHLLETLHLHEKTLKVPPVVRAPAGVLGLHDVEGVDVARFLRGVFSAAMHHLPVDQDHAT